MSVNKEKWHLFMLPEDQANKDIANGFHLSLSDDKLRSMQVLKNCRGWMKVLYYFTTKHIPQMYANKKRMTLLLIDFDNQQNRLLYIQNNTIPFNLADRVFVLGTKSKPEKLKKSIGSFEFIGQMLAQDCSNQTRTTWQHKLLKHNNKELNRMNTLVRPFLF